MFFICLICGRIKLSSRGIVCPLAHLAMSFGGSDRYTAAVPLQPFWSIATVQKRRSGADQRNAAAYLSQSAQSCATVHTGIHTASSQVSEPASSSACVSNVCLWGKSYVGFRNVPMLRPCGSFQHMFTFVHSALSLSIELESYSPTLRPPFLHQTYSENYAWRKASVLITVGKVMICSSSWQCQVQNVTSMVVNGQQVTSKAESPAATNHKPCWSMEVALLHLETKTTWLTWTSKRLVMI